MRNEETVKRAKQRPVWETCTSPTNGQSLNVGMECGRHGVNWRTLNPGGELGSVAIFQA